MAEQQRERILIIDGHSLLFRAFYALPPLRTSTGIPTNAVHGFMRMLLRLMNEEQPQYVVVAWDSGGATFRHEAFSEYKATRMSMPSDLVQQEPIVREALDALNVSQLELPRYEADDLIGTIATKAEQEGLDVLVVTGDHDALQLAGKQTTVIVTERGISQTTRFTPQVVEERLGIPPARVPDYKGLRGDTSDNIPGVPGIGDKTARKLVQELGSIDDILSNLSGVTPARVRTLLSQHAEQARHSRTLATIVKDAPLDVELSSLRTQPPDDKRAFDVFSQYEMKGLATQFRRAHDTPQIDTGAFESEPDAAVAIMESRGVSVPVAMSIITNQNRVECLAVALEDGKAFCVREWKRFRSWLEDEHAPKILHDAKSLILAFRREGVELRGIVTDTSLMAYLLAPEGQSRGLENLARLYLKTTVRVEAPPVLPGMSDVAGASQEGGDPHDILVERTRAILALARTLEAELEDAGLTMLHREVELPLARVLTDMESEGIRVDRRRLRELQKKMDQELSSLEKKVYELAGVTFNINSPKQLQVVLFETLKLPTGRKTKTGYSTDAGVLERLAKQHEVVKKILDYRELTKLKSTYVDALVSLPESKDERIHTSYNQIGAATGRLSSSNPNLMNIPIRTEWGQEIRRAFIPKGSGTHWIVSADYSQIELRILAHLSNDETLIEAFRNDIDIHTRTAADLFIVSLDDVTSEMRRLAKVVNFGIVYGISGFGLSQQLGIEPGEGLRLIESYFQTFSAVQDWIASTLDRARKEGFVTTIFGRRRPVPDLSSHIPRIREAAERVAINMPVQGSAADVIKIAMNLIAARLREERLESRMLLQLHDELVFEAPHHELQIISEMARNEMSNAVNLVVPLKVDVEFGENWLELKPVS